MCHGLTRWQQTKGCSAQAVRKSNVHSESCRHSSHRGQVLVQQFGELGAVKRDMQRKACVLPIFKIAGYHLFLDSAESPQRHMLCIEDSLLAFSQRISDRMYNLLGPDSSLQTPPHCQALKLADSVSSQLSSHIIFALIVYHAQSARHALWPGHPTAGHCREIVTHICLCKRVSYHGRNEDGVHEGNPCGTGRPLEVSPSLFVEFCVAKSVTTSCRRLSES